MSTLRNKQSHKATHKTTYKPTVWTDELVDKLKQFRADGKSPSTISERLKVSREAVVRKIHQLRLPPAAIYVANPANREKAPPLCIRNPVSILDRTREQCGAVLDLTDKQGLAIMCGEPTILNTAWCAHHHFIYLQRQAHHYGQTSHPLQPL